MRSTARPPRKRFTTPAKGTKEREIILLMLKRGVSFSELQYLKLVRHRENIFCLINRLEYDHGMDVRLIDEIKIGHKFHAFYRIVGRHRWNGMYRPFSDEYHECPNIRG